jgi:CubicO group peptidase (beta-lactamase class C family)
MRTLRRCTLLATSLFVPLALAAQSLPRGTPESVGMSSGRLARLGEVLDGYVARDRLPGGVVLVARQGRVAYVHAFGERDRERHAEMGEDAIFRIASQTKAIVSAAVLMLQEDGRLLIGDPVAKYLPAFSKTTVAVPRAGGGYDVVDAARPITIRDLLTHTAGVGYGGGVAADRWKAAGIQGWYFADRDEPIRATVDRMAALPFDAQPGERFVYGYSTDILGAVVEAVSGEPLDRFLRTRILDPLGMKDTYFYLPPDKADRLATVYNLPAGGTLTRAPGGPGMETQGQYVEGPRKSFSGGAGLLSTAEDYARFLQMMLDGGTLDGARILSPKTVQLMTVDHIGPRYGNPGLGFGLGFEIVTDLGAQGAPGSVDRFGWGGAYHSSYWVDPDERLVVVYFTQVIPAAGLDDHGKLRALVYQAITESSAPWWGRAGRVERAREAMPIR